MKKNFLIVICLLLTFTMQAQSYLLKTEKKEEKKKDLTSEELFVKENFPMIDFSDWKDKNIKFLFPANRLDKSKVDISYKLKCGTTYDRKELLGKIVTVSNIYEKEVKCPAGKCKRTYINFTCNNIEFTYEFLGNKHELETTDKNKLVFDLVYLGDVDIAREKLIGKKVYTKTLAGTVLNPITDFPIKKYAEVEIIEIASSVNQYTPVRIVVKDKDDNQYYIDTYFSDTNRTDIYYGMKEIDPLFFGSFFSFDNIRKKHPDISEKTWADIELGNLTIGMTKEECRLAWGIASDVNNTTLDNIESEQWIYRSKSKLVKDKYVYFNDGKVSAIQK